MPFYGVQKGRHGAAVYDTWYECKKDVHGYSGAVFKRFETEEEAVNFAFSENSSKEAKLANSYDAIVFTDGSYEDGNNPCGYAAVFVRDNEKIGILYGPMREYLESRNIAGEVKAAQRAIEKSMELGLGKVLICHDYSGIGHWARGEWKRNIPLTSEFFELVKEAEKSMTIDFEQVKGHSGNRFNEMADEYANYGRSKESEVSEGFEEVAPEPSKKETSVQPTETTSKRASYICPVCEKRVARNAKSCKFCGTAFVGDVKPVVKERKDVGDKEEKSEPTATIHAKQEEAHLEPANQEVSEEVQEIEVPILAAWQIRPYVCPVCGNSFEDFEPAFGVAAIGNRAVIKNGIICCCSECAEEAKKSEIAFAKAMLDALKTQEFEIF